MAARRASTGVGFVLICLVCLLLGNRDSIAIILLGITAAGGALLRARQTLSDWRRLAQEPPPSEEPRL